MIKIEKVFEFALYINQTLMYRCDYDISLYFHLIDWCNCSCMGCYRGCSPSASKDTVPVADVEHLVNIFNKLPNFDKRVAVSGGEPSALPAHDLERVLQIPMDADCCVDFITNGSWACDPVKSRQIFKMLSNLRVPKAHHDMDYDEILEIIKLRIPEWNSLTRPEKRRKYNEIVSCPALALVMSVDNLIHPPQSAEWFVAVAKKVTKTPKLSRRVGLNAATFTNCEEWFRKSVLNNPELNCSDIWKDGEKMSLKINGISSLTFFQTFGDPADETETSSMMGQILAAGRKSANMMYCVWPDRTIGFQNELGKPIGRVSYIDDNDGYKDIETLRKEMAIELTSGYAKKIKFKVTKEELRYLFDRLHSKML